MKTLTQEQAGYLRGRGYTHIAAIVKSVGYSKYYNVNSIDEVMKNDGKWIACGCGMHRFRNGSWRSIIFGTIGNQIDWRKTITRRHAAYLLSEYCKT